MSSFTDEERGTSSLRRRWVGRAAVIVAVVVLGAAVVMLTDLARTGKAPWEAWFAAPTPAVSASASPSASGSAAAAAAGSDSPTPSPTATDAGDAIDLGDPAMRVWLEDMRIATILKMDAADPAIPANFATVVLTPRDTPYTLDDLVAIGAVTADGNGFFTLVRSVLVRSGAVLQIDAPGATLRLHSAPDGFASIVAWGGVLTFSGAQDAPLTVMGVTDAAGTADADLSDGRAYVRVHDGVLATTDVRFNSLGFWSGRTGGIAVTSSATGLGSAQLVRTSIASTHYGVYLSGVLASTLSQVTVTGADDDGIVVSGSSDVTVDQTSVSEVAGDGITVDRAAQKIAITGSTIARTGGHGIRIDGSPLATGPTPGGYLTLRPSDYTLTDVKISDAAEGGVLLIETDKAAVDRVAVEGSSLAVRIVGPANAVTVTGSTLSSTSGAGLAVSQRVRDLSVSDTAVNGHGRGVTVSDSRGTITGGAVGVDVGHPIEVVDDSRVTVTGARLTGSGQDPVFVGAGSTATTSDLDLSAWTFESEFVTFLNNHPMMWLWLLVLVIPLVGLPLIRRRRRAHVELRKLIEDAIVSYGQNQLAAYHEGGAGAGVGAGAGAGAGLGAGAGSSAGADPDAGVAFGSPATGVRETGAPVGARVGAPVGVEGGVPAVVAGGVPAGVASGAPSVAEAPRAAARPPVAEPRSFNDLRAGALAGRDFASMQQFAVAAVLEAGYPVSAIARLFRVPSWRLASWVESAVASAEDDARESVGSTAPRR